MKKFAKIIFVLIVFFGVIGYFTSENYVDGKMQQIENKVALDLVKQYEIAKKNGSAMDAYVQAQMVSAAFLQANDEENYKKWKKIESEEAKRIGL